MTDPQVWTLIGGFLAIFVFTAGLLLRVLQVEIRSLDSRLATVESRLAGRLDVIDTKLGSLDRDVQALTRKVFHQDTP